MIVTELVAPHLIGAFVRRQGGLGLATLTLTRSLAFSVLLAVAGALLPYWFMQKKRARRMGQFEEQLPETIDLLGRAIRAGHPLSAGLRMVADESPEPVQGEFRQAFEEQRFGLPLEDSLMGMADRVGLIDVRILTIDTAEPEHFLTSEKKNVLVDLFVKWKVTDVRQYYASIVVGGGGLSGVETAGEVEDFVRRDPR